LTHRVIGSFGERAGSADELAPNPYVIEDGGPSLRSGDGHESDTHGETHKEADEIQLLAGSQLGPGSPPGGPGVGVGA
jgi:hypothetical protein